MESGQKDFCHKHSCNAKSGVRVIFRAAKKFCYASVSKILYSMRTEEMYRATKLQIL